MSLHNSSDTILTARNATYGDYDHQAAFAQDLKDSMGQAPNWRDLKPSQRESLEMIATKISRILHGNPDHADSWVDIAGYANLGAGWKP
jgi:hypothetical protein